MRFLEGVTPAEDGGPWRVPNQFCCSLSLPLSSSSRVWRCLHFNTKVPLDPSQALLVSAVG